MVPFAASTNPRSIEECYFYHSTDLPKTGPVRGSWDLRGRFDDYLGNVDFRGKHVLDVGCASGFLTFEMERRGASVVSVDAADVSQINFLPFADFWRGFDSWKEEGGGMLAKMKNSYWLAHQEYESKARAWYGDVYNLPSDLGLFDIVVVAQILVHLRDPIAALWSAASRSNDTIIIAEGMIEQDNDKIMRFLSSA